MSKRSFKIFSDETAEPAFFLMQRKNEEKKKEYGTARWSPYEK